MAVLKSKDGKELLIDCDCKCSDGLRVRVDKDRDFNTCYYLIYTSGNWFRDQDETIWKVISKKLEKIWAIIRNKDYYYAEIVMDGNDFNEFKKYISSID